MISLKRKTLLYFRKRRSSQNTKNYFEIPSKHKHFAALVNVNKNKILSLNCVCILKKNVRP